MFFSFWMIFFRLLDWQAYKAKNPGSSRLPHAPSSVFNIFTITEECQFLSYGMATCRNHFLFIKKGFLFNLLLNFVWTMAFKWVVKINRILFIKSGGERLNKIETTTKKIDKQCLTSLWHTWMSPDFFQCFQISTCVCFDLCSPFFSISTAS